MTRGTRNGQAPQPEKRKGRLAGRPSLNLTSARSSTITDSATLIRLQRLRPFGIVGCRADLIASLAWGVPHV